MDNNMFKFTEPVNHLDNHNSEISSADLNETKANITDSESEEKKYFYPVSSETNQVHEETTKSAPIDPQNLADNILDSWDVQSDEFLSNDQFKTELEKEKQEKAQLEKLLATNSIDVSKNTETFPLKSVIPKKTSGSSSNTSLESEEDSSINPEKLAYILIGVKQFENSLEYL